MNALNKQVQEEIRAAAHEAGDREDVRAVVVYGGEKVFAAGADIKEMADMSYPDMADRAHALSSSFTAVAEIPKPTVAALTGYALAAAKSAIDRGLDIDLHSGLNLESHVFAALFATEDREIGMRSFLEHGPGKARFVGR